jgi:two-component system cell cycle sensor histidine kinase/response regulator CckA
MMACAPVIMARPALEGVAASAASPIVRRGGPVGTEYVDGSVLARGAGRGEATLSDAERHPEREDPITPTSARRPRGLGAIRALVPALEIRTWLVLLVLVAVMPGGALLLRGAAIQREMLQDQVTKKLRQTAALAAQRLTATVERAHGAVSAMASLPEIRARDAARCPDIARRVMHAEPEFVNVSVADAEGVVFCTAIPNASGPGRVADRAYFQRAMQRDDAVVGRLVISRVFHRPTLHVAHAVLDGAGRRTGVVFLALDLTHLDDLLASVAAPGEVLTAVDGEGAVAARHPDGGSWIGSKQDAPLVETMLSDVEGTAEVPGLDGVVRLYAFAAVHAADAPTDLKVSAGVERAVALEPVDRAFRRTMVLYGLAVLLGLVAAWLLGEFMLNRRLDRIRAAARSISSGVLEARTGEVHTADGVGELASAFDEMAASIAKLTHENRLILQSVGVGIYGVNREGVVSFVNPAAAQLLGYAAAELRGRNAHDLCHAAGERTGGAGRCALLDAVEDGGVHRFEHVEFRRRDGRTFPVEAVSTPIRDGGEVIGAVITFHDVTGRARLEAQLRHAQKMEAVGRLAGGIAHDFNNLLTVIVSAGRSIAARAPGDEETHAEAEEVLSAAGRAAALTKQLLAFSRAQPMAVVAADVDSIIEKWRPLLARLLGRDLDAALSLKAAGRVRIDPGQLEQVLMNLAVNARDAMPSGGKLTIATSDVLLDGRQSGGRLGAPAGRYVMLAVSDTGTGMDEDTIAQIFEPFFTTKPPGQGTGLGLSTVWGIVKQYGGDIHVYSAPERGTTFKVYFPAVEAAAEPLATPAAKLDLRGTETLLLVEDDAPVRHAAARELRRAGYEVVEAGGAAEALRAVEAGLAFDLLLTDVIMPELSGPELADRVRQLRPSAKVLFMSGFSGAALAHQRILRGEAAFVEKPFTPEGLLAGVREALVRTRAA